WHGHNCHLFKWPSTRPEFWRAKIARNKKVDRRAILALEATGWRVGIVWECALKGRTRLLLPDVIRQCAEWLGSGKLTLTIGGTKLPIAEGCCPIISRVLPSRSLHLSKPLPPNQTSTRCKASCHCAKR